MLLAAATYIHETKIRRQIRVCLHKLLEMHLKQLIVHVHNLLQPIFRLYIAPSVEFRPFNYLLAVLFCRP